MKAFQYLAPIAPFEYAVPRNTAELTAILDSYGDRAKLLAGGTDLTIALKQRSIKPDVIIDLSRLRSLLSGTTVSDTSLQIGAMTTLTQLEGDISIRRYARALSIAASQMGTYQVRNLGTLGGNLVNGSPAADTAPPLIALSARVTLQSSHDERTVPVEDFFTGVKKTKILPNEFLRSVEIPIKKRVSSHWMRVANRNQNVLSVVSVAVASENLGDDFGESRISLGAVAPTPILAREASSIMNRKVMNEETAEAVAVAARSECRPISDVRASAEYRRSMVYVLTKRTIDEIVKGGR